MLSIRANRKKVVAILVLGVTGYVVWYLAFPQVTEPRGPVTPAEAESFAHIKLPPSATNVRIAGYYHGIQLEHYLRCEAPVAECLAAASAITEGQPLKKLTVNDLQFLPVAPIRKGIFRDFSWYDLKLATNVVTATGSAPSMPEVWVDQDRGVLYYSRTD